MKNPFTPTFGIVPPVLAGRSHILHTMHRAFRNWPGDPNLASILIGPRGSGKTALLSCIGDIAREEGWITVDTVAAPGMLEDIYQYLLTAASGILLKKESRHLTGVNIGQILGLSWSVDHENEPISINWRIRMTELLKKLQEQDIGVLITIDEVRADVEEMVQFTSLYQLFVRDGAKIALVMAGLPVQVGNLIGSREVSFLRRCRQIYLEKIPDSEIRAAFQETLRMSGKEIEPDALKLMVSASDGYAYMMQLVGYSVWNAADETQPISSEQAAAGIREAKEDFKNGVLNNTYRELSKGDRAFLAAMLKDPYGSRLPDIANRLQKSSGYAYTYKRRLLQAGVIEEDPDGLLRFAIPTFREYLTELQ